MKNLKLISGEREFTADIYGESASPTVLCLHGFPDNRYSFRYQIDAFVAAGYQVISPSMRGYEPSSITADYDYSMESIAGDVIAWLDQLRLEKVHLLGHDWGAAVAYTVASIAPQRLLSMATIAVPHPHRMMREGMFNVPSQALKSWYMLFNQLPYVSDFWASRDNFSFFKYLWSRWSPNQIIEDEVWSGLTATFSQEGVVSAMLGYYRHNVSLLSMLGLRSTLVNSLEQIDVPNLAITGVDDGCIDTRIFDYAIKQEDHPKGFRVEHIRDAGHFAHQEKPKEVNKIIIDWFSTYDIKMESIQ